MDSIEQEITLGKVEIQEAKYQQASERFQRLLGAHPDNPEIIHGLTIIATNSDDLERALALANKAVQLDDKNSEFANTLSVVRFMTGDKGGAIDALTKIANDNPGDKEAHINLAEMAGSANMPEAAYNALEQYLNHAGADEQVLDIIGQIFNNLLADQPVPERPD
ncbi:MAG: hypothetical protein HOJ87_01600 [Rhodospirillaceae bacterium]|nr:hypothetical protein [Rhodospirillaceae bacterium]MBT5561024.1 hypothetical protein [Rhodospirillaceae bacterium]MBT6240660.1 hypothetical protein [Rhodospirillaceae bacterium]